MTDLMILSEERAHARKGNNLKKMDLWLEVTDDLYNEAKIDADTYTKLINAIELKLVNSPSFKKRIMDWAGSVLAMDSVEGHLENFESMLQSFLASPGADNH
ncbi:hypothetical protein D1013_09535 [Euzebyella marina]|uniref:Uncharacterized protein n=3 Tax=Euzebyella marina TaxID=1761453 RepID=A0A3G2L5N9_9FLAO|nr:hypothetical protein D1013_09535 [Euzebyella marina]